MTGHKDCAAREREEIAVNNVNRPSSYYVISQQVRLTTTLSKLGTVSFTMFLDSATEPAAKAPPMAQKHGRIAAAVARFVAIAVAILLWIGIAWLLRRIRIW